MDFRKVITNISRVLVGVLFIFSGLIKANDPLGFSYKLEEYFSVFGTDFLIPLALALSIFVCVFEIFLGITLLLGVYRKFTAWMLLLMIVFFTFLTFYSAYFNKVTDCGCFGDAIKLTPWQSFWKDIILLVLILIIFFNWYLIKPIINRGTGRIIAWLGLLASLAFTLHVWYYLPMVDFRPYAIGKDIQKQMEVPPGSPTDSFVMTFIYEKDGNKQEFSMDDISAGKADSTWKFIERKDKLVREGEKPAIHDFAMYDESGDDITQQFLTEKGYKLLIINYDVEKSSKDGQVKVNGLAMTIMRNNKKKPNMPKVQIYGLTGSSQALVDWYKATHMVPYSFYQVDATVLKTIIRSNPGLVLLKDNVVIEKWPATDVPDKDEFYNALK